MTEFEVERLVVRLMGDAEGYQKMLADAEGGAKHSASAIEQSMGRIEASSVAAGVLAAGAMQRMAGAIIESGKEVMRAWDDQENANIELRATLRANGRDVEKLFGEYDEFASKMQETTRLADEQVTALLTQAESFQLTGNAAKKATKDAIGLAKGSAQGASGMMRVTAAMAQGDIKRAMMFSRMIPQLRGVKNETEFLAKYQKLVAAGLEAAGEKAKTFFGRLEQLKNVISDLYEDFGRIIGDALKPFIDQLKRGVLWLKGLSDQTKKTIAVVAGLIAAFSLGSMVVMISRAIPLVGMLGSAFSAAFSLIPLLLGPFGPLLALAAAGAVILVQRLGGVGATIEKVKGIAVSFWEYVRPMMLQFGNVAKAVFEGFWNIAKTVFDNVARFVAWAWGGVGDKAEATFANVKTFIVEAMIAAEFYVRNFGRFAALTWVNAEHGVVKFANQVVYFFTVVIPTTVRWFADNFKDIFFTSLDYVLTLFVNLGKNVRSLWTAVLDWFAGEPFKFDPTPMTEGFRSTIKKLPQIADREIGALEKSLADESKAITEGLAKDYLAFRDERLKELTELPKVEDATKPMDDFKESVAGVTGAVKDMKEELKPDAIRYDSAKAVQAAQDYFDALRGGARDAKQALVDASGAGAKSLLGAPAVPGASATPRQVPRPRPAPSTPAGTPPPPPSPAPPRPPAIPTKLEVPATVPRVPSAVAHHEKVLQGRAAREAAAVARETAKEQKRLARETTINDAKAAREQALVRAETIKEQARLARESVGKPIPMLPTGVEPNAEEFAARIDEIKRRSEEARRLSGEGAARGAEAMARAAEQREANLARIKEEMRGKQTVAVEHRGRVREDQMTRQGGEKTIEEIAATLKEMLELAQKDKGAAVTLSPAGI